MFKPLEKKQLWKSQILQLWCQGSLFTCNLLQEWREKVKHEGTKEHYFEVNFTGEFSAGLLLFLRK